MAAGASASALASPVTYIGPDSDLSEQELRAYEAATLGPEHAAEHAAIRRAAHDASTRSRASARRSTSVRPGYALRPAHRPATASPSTLAAGPPEEVGAWTQAPFELPNYAIHAALLPTGKVLFWGYPPLDASYARPNFGEAALWNPAAGTGPGAFEEIPPPLMDVDGDGDLEPTPIYCSGQSPLPNGALLVAGGNLAAPQTPNDPWTDYAGLNSLLTFNPWTEQWVPQPSLSVGRWYPSQAQLADGRTVIFGGYTEQVPGGVLGNSLEVFTPAASPGGVGTVQTKPTASRPGTLYPHMFSLPSGRVLLAGPTPTDAGVLTPSNMRWNNNVAPPRFRQGGTAVVVPKQPWWVMAIGGYSQAGPDGVGHAMTSVETLHGRYPANAWQPAGSLNVRRSYHNSVLLPDGSIATVGGGVGFNPEDGNFAVDPLGPQRQVELYDAATDSWRLGPAQQEDRGYHSTALLLPDGRVWSAGDDVHPKQPDGSFAATDTGEIYSPPYLFKGPRPVISSAPTTITYQQRFVIDTATSPAATSAVLVAPGAPTHAADMNQRVIRLPRKAFTPSGDLDVISPASAGEAPPGYYMMFVLTGKGVPSTAKWVKLG